MKFVIGVAKIMFMSPQIIIFMELIYNWLRTAFKELKKCEKFPVGVYRHVVHKV